MPRPEVVGGVAVGRSTIPGAGMGLFAAEDLPKYQIVGEYSGEVKSYARFGEKVDRLGHNHLHPFYLKPGLIVDPTDEEGALDPASLSMAFTNEAPPGGRYNLLALYTWPEPDEQPAVYFCTREAINKGSELFVCYGYDHPREYPWAQPEVELDMEQRLEISERHPQLSPDFPPKEDMVERQDEALPKSQWDLEPKCSEFEVGTEERMASL